VYQSLGPDNEEFGLIRCATTATTPPKTIRATVDSLKTVKDSLSRIVNLVLMELSKTMETKAMAAMSLSILASGKSPVLDVTDPMDSAMTILWMAMDEGFTPRMYTQAMRKAAVSP
jgi:hypothetical protein